MPSWEQLRRAEEAVQRFRERVGPKVDVLWVLPDFYEELPKPCMGGWGRTAMVVAPNGDVLPCQAASTIPGLEFANVRDHPLEWIWSESDAFARFRGTDWMQEPCRTCPLGRQEVDWGGCRCQALRLAGDAAATDPVCRFSPHHDRVVAAREPAQTEQFVYRTMKRPRVSDSSEPQRAAHGRDVAARHGHRLARRAVHDQRQLAPRPAVDRADAGQVDDEPPMDAHELASGELLLELVDAMNRGLEASLVGDEPDVVAVRLRETDLGPAQQDHALAAHAHDARRRAQRRARAARARSGHRARLRRPRASRSAGRPGRPGAG